MKTTPKGIPYTEGTDTVAAMQQIIAALAVKVDELMTEWET